MEHPGFTASLTCIGRTRYAFWILPRRRCRPTSTTSANASPCWIILAFGDKAGPLARGWWKVPTNWWCKLASKGQACIGSPATSTPCSLCGARSVVAAGMRRGDRSFTRSRPCAPPLGESRHSIAVRRWFLRRCSCSCAFVLPLLARRLPCPLHFPAPRTQLPPCLARRVLLLIIPGNAGCFAVLPPLQKLDGHPASQALLTN